MTLIIYLPLFLLARISLGVSNAAGYSGACSSLCSSSEVRLLHQCFGESGASLCVNQTKAGLRGWCIYIQFSIQLPDLLLHNEYDQLLSPQRSLKFHLTSSVNSVWSTNCQTQFIVKTSRSYLVQRSVYIASYSSLYSP